MFHFAEDVVSLFAITFINRLLLFRFRTQYAPGDEPDPIYNCNNVKKVMKRGEPFLFELRDFLTFCFRFAGQKYVYAA